MRRYLPLLVLLFSVAQADTITVRKTLVENFDGTFDTAFPDGDKSTTPSAGDWSVTAIGDGVCSSVVDDTGVLTIVAAGTTENDSCFVHQRVASGDVQLTYRITTDSDFSGGTQTALGPYVGGAIWDSTASGAPHVMNRWRSNIDRHVGQYRVLQGGSVTSGIFGATGLTEPIYGGVTFDDSADAAAMWETDAVSPADASDWNGIVAGLDMEDGLQYPLEVGFIVTSFHESNTVTAVLDNISIDSTISLVDQTERNVQFTNAFESGSIQSKSSSVDGFFIHTLPITQTGTTSFSSNSGCCDPDSSLDTRVTEGRVPPTTGNGAATEGTVGPRAGTYYLEALIDKSKDYTTLNAGLHKPRTKINPQPDDRFDFDVEGYTGFSVYLPTNYELEANARRTLLYAQNTTPSATLLTIELGAPEVGRTKWAAITHTSATSVSESVGARIEYDLGLIEEDLGKWTDIIVRYRWNPFTTTTNASTISGGKDQSYEGNKGILQIWKSTGEEDGNGNRAMALVVDLEDGPVGLVPKATPQIQQTFKIYKPTWQTSSTTIVGPIWIGFDEIRTGFVTADSTDFGDVHPGGQTCADIAVVPASCP